MTAGTTIFGRARRALSRTLNRDRAEAPVMVIVGATVFAIFTFAAVSSLGAFTDDGARSSVNTAREQALQQQIVGFKSMTWKQMLDDASKGKNGVLKHSLTRADIADATKDTDETANYDAGATRPFAYYSKISSVDNSVQQVDTPGGATNSDGSYLLELLAPKLNHDLSECKRWPTIERPSIPSGCIYIKGTRTPAFADAAAVPNWKGLVSTVTEQVRGTYAVTSPSTVTFAKVNTCQMKVDQVQVSFQWRPDDGATLKPTSVQHILTDGRKAEFFAVSTSTVNNGAATIVSGYFNRGTSSVCGDQDKLQVAFEGAGKGQITGMLLTPVTEPVGTNTQAPAPAQDLRLQVGSDGVYYVAWNAGSGRTAYPATAFQVKNTCTDTTTVTSAPRATSNYTGARYKLTPKSGESIEDFIDRCPVIQVTAQGSAGKLADSVRSALSSLDTEYTSLAATYDKASRKVTVNYPSMPAFLQNRISDMSVYYCYARADHPGEGCSVAPINDLGNATKAGTADFKKQSSFSFTAPALNTIKDGKLIIQAINTNTRQATKSPSNYVTLTVTS